MKAGLHYGIALCARQHGGEAASRTGKQGCQVSLCLRRGAGV